MGSSGHARPSGTLSDPDLLPIVRCGDPILRRAAEPVDPDELRGPQLQLLVARMRATMEAAPGVGLAAPQVGVGLQIAVLQDGPDRWRQLSEGERAARERNELPFTVLVNPTLEPVDDDDLVGFYEGCLSVPGFTAVVARYRTVRVRALDQYGAPVDDVFSGWAARIAQHEIDHLHGCLYLDRAESRSLSTTDNYAARWAGRSTADAAEALGFVLPASDKGRARG